MVFLISISPAGATATRRLDRALSNARHTTAADAANEAAHLQSADGREDSDQIPRFASALAT